MQRRNFLKKLKNFVNKRHTILSSCGFVVSFVNDWEMKKRVCFVLFCLAPSHCNSNVVFVTHGRQKIFPTTQTKIRRIVSWRTKRFFHKFDIWDLGFFIPPPLIYFILSRRKKTCSNKWKANFSFFWARRKFSSNWKKAQTFFHRFVTHFYRTKRDQQRKWSYQRQ